VPHLDISVTEFKSLKIRDLTVERLRASEVTVTDSLRLPESHANREIDL
jgi:hypothetical protein